MAGRLHILNLWYVFSYVEPGACVDNSPGLFFIVFSTPYLLSTSVQPNWIHRSINTISCICRHIRTGGGSVLFSVGHTFFVSRIVFSDL